MTEGGGHDRRLCSRYPTDHHEGSLTIGYYRVVEISGRTENGQGEGLKHATGRPRIIPVSRWRQLKQILFNELASITQETLPISDALQGVITWKRLATRVWHGNDSLIQGMDTVTPLERFCLATSARIRSGSAEQTCGLFCAYEPLHVNNPESASGCGEKWLRASLQHISCMSLFPVRHPVPCSTCGYIRLHSYCIPLCHYRSPGRCNTRRDFDLTSSGSHLSGRYCTPATQIAEWPP